MTTMPGSERGHSPGKVAAASAGVLAVLVIAALWQREHPYSIETTADIDASPAEVWAVLGDLESYAEWNPTFIGVDGELVEGGELSYNGGTARVVEVREESLVRLSTRVGVLGLLDGDHTLELVELDDGSTRFVQREDFRGIAVPFVTGSLRDETAPAFHEMNAALRDRVESQGE